MLYTMVLCCLADWPSQTGTVCDMHLHLAIEYANRILAQHILYRTQPNLKLRTHGINFTKCNNEIKIATQKCIDMI